MRSFNNYGRKCFSYLLLIHNMEKIVVIQYCEAWLNDIQVRLL